MNLPRMFLRTAALCLCLCACSLFQPAGHDKSKDKAPKNPPQLVGRIASIPADKRFVLIQSYGTWNIESGTVLTTRGPDDRTANLRTTGESLGQFAAADLQSGLVEVGDAVYTSHIPKPATAPEEPGTATQPLENQQKPRTENVQKNN